VKRRSNRLAGNPVADVSDLLDDLAIPYVFTGTIAYSYWVRPTATIDVDVVVYTRVEASGGLDGPCTNRSARSFAASAHRLAAPGEA
jgi:hypothetical protein